MGTDPQDPDHAQNPYGNGNPEHYRKPSATVTGVDPPATEWREGHRARQGVWRLENTGNFPPGWIEFIVPNEKNNNKVKDVWVQVTYDDVTGEPQVGATMPPQQSGAYEDLVEVGKQQWPNPLPGGWKHLTYQFQAPRCPPWVEVTVEYPEGGIGKVVYIDQVVIDTNCRAAQGATYHGGVQLNPGRTQTDTDLITDSFQGVVTDNAKLSGSITAYRTDLSAGDSFSGTVTSEAKDESQLSGMVYQVVEQDPSGAETVVAEAPVARGVFKGVLPAAAAAGGGALLFGRLVKGGNEVARAQKTPVHPQPAATGVQPGFSAASCQFPPLMQAGRPAAIKFQGGGGDLATTQVTVGGQPAQTLAEGPTKCVFRSPAGVTGPTTVTYSKNGVVATGQSRSVAINLSALSRTLPRGTEEEIKVTASGLQGLESPLSFALDNTTPAVQLEGGNHQIITIQPGAEQPDGTYQCARGAKATQPGTFNILGTLLVPDVPGPVIGAAPGGGGGVLAVAKFDAYDKDGKKVGARELSDKNIKPCKGGTCAKPTAIAKGDDKGKIYCSDKACAKPDKDCPQPLCHMFQAWIDGTPGKNGVPANGKKDENEELTLIDQGIGEKNAIKPEDNRCYACVCK